MIINIDVACPFDTRVVSKQRQKIDNYCDLKYEIKSEFGTVVQFSSVQVIPIVIGALGTVSRVWNAAETVGNAILHGTFTTNSLSGVRKESAKSAGHLIILRTEQMAWSILGHRLCPDTQ